MSKIIVELMGIGLSIDEATVYAALLKKNQCTATELSKISSINRTKIYSILSSLIKRGLCSEKLGAVKKYEIIPPDAAFGKMIDEQKNMMTKLLRLPKIITPFYNSNKGNRSPLDYVQVFTTINSIVNKNVALELESNKSVISFCRPPYAMRKEPKIRDVQTKNMKAGMLYKSIYQIEPDDLEYFALCMKTYEDGGESIRVHDNLPIKLHVFDKQKVFFSLIDQINPKDNLTYLTIEHPDIAKTLLYVFDMFWNSALTVDELIKRENIKLKNVL
jgi:HTH-type transcriptional regulator, sugar sensing transcriptional regulator